MPIVPSYSCGLTAAQLRALVGLIKQRHPGFNLFVGGVTGDMYVAFTQDKVDAVVTPLGETIDPSKEEA